MIIKYKKMPPNMSIQGMCGLVQRETDRFGLFLDLDRINEYHFYYSMVQRNAAKHICNLVGVTDYSFTDRTATYNILTKILGVPANMLTDVHTLKPSVATGYIQKVAKAYAGTGGAVEEFLKYYDEGNNATTIVNTYNGYLTLPQTSKRDRDGHRMLIAHPRWSILSTSRMSASDPACQNINRDHFDIVTAPAGYQLIRADSGQIEPRIQWSYFTRDQLICDLISAYDDAYFAYFDYISMSEAREEALRKDFAKNFTKLEISDELKEGRQQMKRMSLAANYGSSLPTDAGFDPRLAKLYTARIVNHPARLKLVQRIREEVYRGRDTFEGAFGTKVTPEATDKYSPGSSGWQEHLIRCGMNNPIQTTASELNCFAIYNCMDILQNKCKSSALAYSKHDEGAVYLNEDNGDIDYAEEIADCWSYIIEGWIPIRSELEVGRKAPHNNVVSLL